MFQNRSCIVLSFVPGWTALLVIAGCGGGSTPDTANPGGAVRKPVVIFAAASAREPVEELARRFREDTGCEVTVSPGASSLLAKQIDQGAAVDLFLAADEASVEYLLARQKIHSRLDLLTNRLCVVAPADSKLELKSLADLADAKFAKIAIAEAKVPAGEYARQALVKVGVLDKVESRFVGGVDVRATLQFVARGECEAGFVYATDIRTTKDVKVLLDVQPHLHKPIVYPLVIVQGGQADSVDLSKFYDLLTSDRGTEVFRLAGFGRFVETAATSP